MTSSRASMSPSSSVGRLRRRLLTPASREVDPGVRGFEPWEGAESVVAPVGTAFLEGYAAAMEARTSVEAVRAIAHLPDQWRGFAVEGAGMALAVRDALGVRSRRRFHEALVYCGDRHTYLLHVGLGWAMARIPRLLWPDLSTMDPGLAGLALDGFGFHEVFFHTDKVRRGEVGFPLAAWPGTTAAGNGHLLQGVGRGLWFVAGGSPERLRALVQEQEPKHASSLWSGIGLAAAYAGGRGEDGLRTLVEASGTQAGWLRQGAGFAVEARVRGGNVVPHTETAARVLCGQSVGEVVAAVRRARPGAREVEFVGHDSYELWRCRVVEEMAERPSSLNRAG